VSSWLSTILLLSFLTLLSGGALWVRHQRGDLFTPSGGLHFQVFLFFCLGGFCYVLFSEVEPNLSSDQILDYGYAACLPILIGYTIVVACEYIWLWKSKGEDVRRRGASFDITNSFPLHTRLLVSGFGSAGLLLQQILANSPLEQLSTYLSLFFFPALLLGMASWKRANAMGNGITILLLIQSLVTSFYSAWRSMLIITLVTILLGISANRMSRNRQLSMLAAGLVGFLLLCYVIPFQIMKRNDIVAFETDPESVVIASLNISLGDRISTVGEFIASRMTYLRESIYVDLAVENGFDLQNGETYINIFNQLIPRMVWPDKPEVAQWAGFDLPRSVGLLQRDDETTSWAVNMFAEATYNFGIWCTLWFVPLAFGFVHIFQAMLRRLYRTREAMVLANVVAFYLVLETTTVIFMSSLIVSLILIVKIVEISTSYGALRERPR
jgi:hypothetical protein